tara:strand:- start:621 stop:1124 length:504 start_codon:yes stop_codon:yes gene_type:complete
MMMTCSTPIQEAIFSPVANFFEAKLGNMYQLKETVAGQSATLTKVQLDFINSARHENFCVGFSNADSGDLESIFSVNLKHQYSSLLSRSSCPLDAKKASNPTSEIRAKRVISLLFHGWLLRMNGMKSLILRQSARVTGTGTESWLNYVLALIQVNFLNLKEDLNHAF